MQLRKKPEMTVEELSPLQLPLVNRFFKANGHKGKARSNERVMVLKEDGGIVAALRACPTSQGYLLRSVWVDTQRRGEGVGSQLLNWALPVLNSDCWCYLYNHLMGFYEKSGFVVVEPEQVPEDIAKPYLNYRSKGQSFLLMAFHQRQLTE